MTGIHTYSTTASENVQANTGINWDEGMAPSAVNNSARQNMADIRGRWNDAAWFQYGIGSKSVTATYVGATQFTVTGADATAAWHKGRRVKAVGSSTGTIYGTISAAAYNSGTTVTTITVVWDSGSLSNETLSIYLAAPAPVTGSPIAPDAVSQIEGTLASATTTDLGSIGNSRINVTGTTTITGFGTGANKKRLVRFSGILTLTHNATSLILLGGISRTTAAGDIGEYVSDGSGNWRETGYQRAASDPGDRATKTGTETLTNKTITSPSIATATFTGTQTFQALIDASGASAGQIKFPATQNGSSDANTLDDYEEGTWTPAYNRASTYTVQNGNYIKVGSFVWLFFNIQTTAVGSGALAITGLPFTALAGTNVDGGCGLSKWTGVTLAANYYSIGAGINQGAATLGLYTSGTGNALAQINGSAFANPATICGMICYQATS